MEHLSPEMEHQEQLQMQWRRDKVQELCSKGYSQREISQVLNNEYSKTASQLCQQKVRTKCQQQQTKINNNN